MIRKYWVMAWADYYPSGGLDNVHSTYATREEAMKALEEIKAKDEDDNAIMMDISDYLEGRDWSRDEYYEALLTMFDRMPPNYKTVMMKAMEIELDRLLAQTQFKG